jgi:thiol-disulfide isomerase/thioredoxin
MIFGEAWKYMAFAVFAAILGVTAAFLFTLGEREARREPDAGFAAGKFIRHTQPRMVADISFTDSEGRLRRLSEWRGRTVLVNLWATWCTPCKMEMPSLDRLQAKMSEIAVIALSVDRSGPKAPAAFLRDQGITHLQLHHDKTGEATARLRAEGLPTTLVVNENGEEIARLIGPEDWDRASMLAELDALRGRQAATTLP